MAGAAPPKCGRDFVIVAGSAATLTGGGTDMAFDPRHNSRTITDGPTRAAARSYYYSIGFTTEDLRKPIIGIANTWIGTMPCNFNLRLLAEKVAAGVRRAGGTPMEFNTIAISDGITMGTEGMKTSLISRELIADSIELCTRGYMFDALVCLVGCDKTIPAASMALARLNIPGIVLYGGTILAGTYKGKDVNIQDVFEGWGSMLRGSCRTRSWTASSTRRVRVRARAAGSSQRTRCRWRWSSWGCRRSG